MLKANTAVKFSLIEKLVPSSLLESVILKLPFHHIEKGVLNVNLFNRTHRFEGTKPGHHAELSILRPGRAFWLIKTQGELGFAQAYLEGAIDTNSLSELMYVGQQNRHVFDGLLNNKSMQFWKLWTHKNNHNSLKNSRKNISYHYDLGNDFYSLWLDRSMTYSSALFDHNTNSLEEAQHNKYQYLFDQVGIQQGDSVLEIGCGWGGFMEHCVKNRVEVTGLTLSQEQKKYAEQRLADQESSEPHGIKLLDYRHETGQYDHIVSIEMFEAVGKEYWDNYFRTLKRCLNPCGKVGLQVITIADEFAESYQRSVDFIQAYIFPGGLLPSVNQLHQLAAEHGFKVEQNTDFGQDYGVTCRLWKQSFNKQADTLLQQGYDKPFQKLWNYYLDYCAVGFETGHISVNQLVLSRV